MFSIIVGSNTFPSGWKIEINGTFMVIDFVILCLVITIISYQKRTLCSLDLAFLQTLILLLLMLTQRMRDACPHAEVSHPQRTIPRQAPLSLL